MAASTEKEFLSVGSSLTGFYARASEISAMCSSLIDSMSGEEILRIMQEFRRLLGSLDAYLAQTEKEFNDGIVVLQNILNIVANIYKPVSGFRKIVKTLKILGISTKIESSQLKENNNGFITIAEDVERLSLLIDSRFSNILASTETLKNVVQQTLSRILGLETMKQGKVRSILDNAQSTILSLSEKNRSSAVTAGKISEDLETITKRIGEVVSSLQFHDITRQQIEHVEDALNGLCTRLDKAELSSLPAQTKLMPLRYTSGDGDEITIDTYAVCELQRAQLNDSEQRFVGAVERIIDNLKNIAVNITGVYRNVQDMAGAEDQMSTSFFSKLELGVSEAISSLGEVKDTIEDLSAAMQSLTSTVTDMSKFMYDIEEIGSEIELIAVNALIKSAHTGAEGAPLGVIADAIRKLSADARLQKVAIADELQSIVLAAEGLDRDIHLNARDQTSETDSVLKDLGRLMERLDSSNDAVISLLGRIQKEGKGLAVDIERTASRITVQNSFPRDTANARSGLGAVISQSAELVPELHKKDKLNLLKNLENNYTMHSERTVHRAITSNRPREGGNPAEDTSLRSEDSFGDNVELF